MRDLLFLTVLLGILPIALMRPWIGVLAWAWVGYMNPHRLGWGFSRDFPAALLVGAAVLIGLLIARDRKAIPWNREMGILALLAAYFTFTTLFAMAPDAAWHQWDKVMKILLMTFVSTMLIYGKDRIHALLMVTALSIGFFGLKGGIFTFLTGGHHRIYGPGGSFIADNNSLGLAMIMVLPLLFFLAREESRKWLRRLLYATAAFTVVSVIFTYSRGALLGLAAIAPFLLLKTRKKALVTLFLVPAVWLVAEFAPPELYGRARSIQTYEQDMSSMQRLQAWSVAWNVAKAHPFTGGGFNLAYLDDAAWLSYADRQYDQWGNVARAAHSIYFQVLGDHGFVALGLFLALILSTLLSLRRIKREAAHDPSTAWLANYASSVQIGLVGFMVSGAFLSLAYFDLFYSYVALTAIMSRELAARETAPEGAGVRWRPLKVAAARRVG
jgi:probable O-glycosylation ligase (exosortase A-associated)